MVMDKGRLAKQRRRPNWTKLDHDQFELCVVASRDL
jgi:hypothetical protein